MLVYWGVGKHDFPQCNFGVTEVIADSEPPPPPVENLVLGVAVNGNICCNVMFAKHWRMELKNPEPEVFSESFLYFSIPNQDEKQFRLREFWWWGMKCFFKTHSSSS